MSDHTDLTLSPLLRAELGELVERHSEIAMRRILRDIGIYIETDEDRRETRKDFNHLRMWREWFSTLAGKIGTLVILAVVTGALTLVTLGAKLYIKTP